MLISFSGREQYIIKIWSDNVIHGGHWGNGDVVFPDEENLLNKIQHLNNGTVDLLLRDIEVLLVWAGSSMGTPEEEILEVRLKKLLQDIR